MHLKLLLAIVAISAFGCLTNAAIIKARDSKTTWELIEALTASSQIRGFNGTWITDEEFYYTATDRSIHKKNVYSGADTVFVTSEFLQFYSQGSSFTFSPDTTKILVRYDVEEIFRHSLIAKYDVYDIATKTAINIHKGEKLQYCAWSPISDRLSYVFDNNVFVRFESGTETQITTEGVNGVIYNGIPDWVYEEEVLSSGSAMWWSPDGSKLAVGSFNDTNVRTYKYFLYGEAEIPEYQYPKEVDLKYPKPGTPNPMVALRIFDLTATEATSVTLTAPMNIVSADHILQNVAWANNDNLLMTWLNRRQNIASIQLCTSKGECREVKRLDEPDGWVTMSTPICLKSGQNCIFTYWIDDWYQVWNLNLLTGENVWNSLGEFTVLRIYGYDEVEDKLYYQATVKDEPHVYQVYSNNECLTCEKKHITSEKCRSASASFSKGFSYYTMVCNGLLLAYTKVFATRNNVEYASWEENTDFRVALESKQLPSVEYWKVPLADGTDVWVKVELPPNLNKQQPKKYPMIVYVYGGPNSVRVTSAFGLGFNTYMATTREVIYVQIDGRGTGNKGKKLLFSVNNNLGQHEVEDQIFVTKYLIEKYPFIDGERVGIWGWSYGGYMAAKTLDVDSERVFQCGVSVAPVTSWLYYDTIYTERYMGLPTEEDNLQKYMESSVLENVDNFRTHDFLLIHGSGDDNVHYQQSLMLAKVLQQNDILFEEMTYTDENHGIGNFLPHLYNTMDHFWINCLNLDVGDDVEE